MKAPSTSPMSTMTEVRLLSIYLFFSCYVVRTFPDPFPLLCMTTTATTTSSLSSSSTTTTTTDTVQHMAGNSFADMVDSAEIIRVRVRL